MLYVTTREKFDAFTPIRTLQSDCGSDGGRYFPYKMPHISQQELERDHSGMPHGGFVMRSGVTGATRQLMEFSLKLDSNPEFTSSVLVCCARAAYRLKQEGFSGAKTIFDVPIAYLSPKSGEELRRTLL